MVDENAVGTVQTRDLQLRIAHVIAGLNTGGAEKMLWKLLSRMDRARFENVVISLTTDGPVGAEIRSLGVPVHALNMRRGLPSPRAVLRLAKWLKAMRPDVVQTWMYHADLIGGLVARLAGSRTVLWNLRQSNFDASASKRTTVWTARLCARLSRLIPRAIICCSQEAERIHVEMGYAKEKITIIPNGFDLEAFRPDPEARAALRQELGVSREELLIGMVARFDPQKDHRTFIKAAALVLRQRSDAKFVLVGEGVSAGNTMLLGWLRAANVMDHFLLLGRRNDVARILNTLDVASLSSAFGEGFPNVVGEAMACGVPCVVTDVGDSAWLVGTAGRVVPVRNPEALARAWLDLLESDSSQRRAVGAVGRARISEHFEIGAIARRYRDLWQEMGIAVQTDAKARAG